MSDNPYESPPTPGKSLSQKKGTLGRRLLELLAVVAIIGLLVALLLPARRGAGEASRRSQCGHNLRQISLALLNYEEDYHALPPAYTVDAKGNPLHSWRTLILPYLEQQALYDTIDLSKPWNDPSNKKAFETDLSAFRCPSVPRVQGHTAYLAVVAPGGCFQPTKSRQLSEITDGNNLTLMVVEVDAESAVHWMSPADAGEKWLQNLETSLTHPHPAGFQATFVDASVHFLLSDTKTEVLRALISIAGDDDEVAGEAY